MAEGAEPSERPGRLRKGWFVRDCAWPFTVDQIGRLLPSHEPGSLLRRARVGHILPVRRGGCP